MKEAIGSARARAAGLRCPLARRASGASAPPWRPGLHRPREVETLAAPAAAAAAAPDPITRHPWGDDGSEGSAAQHNTRSNRAWCETDAARAFRRTSFTWKDWRKHRSTQRYVYHLSTITASRIVRGLMRPVGFITAFAAAVCAYQSLHAAALLPPALPSLPPVPLEPFQLTSFALALLLVFRTNGAYQRWHEARCVFGRIGDTARDVWRQCLAVFPRERAAARASAGRWLVAFTYASKWALREEGVCRRDLEGVLPPKELDALIAAPDPPHYAMLVLSHTLRANLAGFQLVSLVEAIGSMMYSLSSCTRILTTPIPLSYTRATTRFMVLWLLLLPLALLPKCGAGAIPATALVSLALLTIEAIGVSLEEPFSILALETICDGVKRGVATMGTMDDAAHAMASSIAGAAAGLGNSSGGGGDIHATASAAVAAAAAAAAGAGGEGGLQLHLPPVPVVAVPVGRGHRAAADDEVPEMHAAAHGIDIIGPGAGSGPLDTAQPPADGQQQQQLIGARSRPPSTVGR